MTNEFAIKVLTELKGYGDKFANIGFDRKEALDLAIKALEQQPSEDAVSRQMVLQCIKESREGIDWGQSEDEDAFLHYSATLYRTIASKECFPSVNPQQKPGEWIEVEVCNCHATLKCSVCDRVIEPTFTYGEYSYDDIKEWYPYCHCGAKMGGGEE